jgi:hypothetical protein
MEMAYTGPVVEETGFWPGCPALLAPCPSCGEADRLRWKRESGSFSPAGIACCSCGYEGPLTGTKARCLNSHVTIVVWNKRNKSSVALGYPVTLWQVEERLRLRGKWFESQLGRGYSKIIDVSSVLRKHRKGG